MKIKKIKFIILSCYLVINSNLVNAQPTINLPRFVSIKSNEVNIRTGPNIRYPIKWVYIKSDEPVEIIAEFEHWRKIIDIDKEEGWVHKTMLSGKRTAIINSNKIQTVYSTANNETKKIFNIEPKARVTLDSCNQDWCQIGIQNLKGWIKKDYLWGVYKKEEFKK